MLPGVGPGFAWAAAAGGQRFARRLTPRAAGVGDWEEAPSASRFWSRPAGTNGASWQAAEK